MTSRTTVFAVLFCIVYLHLSSAFVINKVLPQFSSKFIMTGRIISKKNMRTPSRGPRMQSTVGISESIEKQKSSDHDILLRVAKGESAERTPVWLMRQAGRYMKAFREYSDKFPFRVRSETPDIAIELSLQPFRAFKTDGVIMFSDILTPLPSMGIEFDVVKGSGPVIFEPIRTSEQISNLKKIDDPDKSTPFIRTILSSLRQETEGKTTLLGFVGSPFTLAAYAVEGKANKNCFQTKKMMYNNPELLHSVLSHIADSIGVYACHQARLAMDAIRARCDMEQVECGAQVIQLFESWAHHLGPDDFSVFAKPYADRVAAALKAKHPGVPVIYFANGGSSYLERQADMKADMIGVDWAVDMAEARRRLGPGVPISGNVDPLVLMGPERKIREAVRECIRKAGGQGHVLNLGHGIIEPTPEAAVAAFVDEARRFRLSPDP